MNEMNYINLLSDNIYKEVIESPEFERLKDISFLGILDHCCLDGNKYTTRYDHSISVANLCLIYSKKKNFSEIDENYIVLAGLLHDLGHCCFSHSLEPVFEKKFAITHHSITRDLIEYSPNLLEIWDKYNINPNRVIETIEGQSNKSDRMVTKISFNFDTLDGIVRTESHFADSHLVGHISKRLFNILCDENKWNSHARLFDSFWEEKDRIYNSYIYNEKHRYYEVLFQNLFMNDESLESEHCLLTDSQMLSEFRWVKLFIDHLGNNDTNDLFLDDLMSNDNYCSILESEIRRFAISSDEDFCPHNSNRYLVSKEISKFSNLDNYALPILR